MKNAVQQLRFLSRYHCVTSDSLIELELGLSLCFRTLIETQKSLKKNPKNQNTINASQNVPVGKKPNPTCETCGSACFHYKFFVKLAWGIILNLSSCSLNCCSCEPGVPMLMWREGMCKRVINFSFYHTSRIYMKILYKENIVSHS